MEDKSLPRTKVIPRAFGPSDSTPTRGGTEVSDRGLVEGYDFVELACTERSRGVEGIKDENTLIRLC